jgi:hypothetical protein
MERPLVGRALSRDRSIQDGWLPILLQTHEQ